MTITDDAIYEIWLSSCHKIGAARAKLLVDYFGSAENVYRARRREFQRIGRFKEPAIKELMKKDLSEVDRIIESCEKTGCEIVGITNEKYPEKLRNIFDPPTVLYVKGKLPPVDELPVVGIVGTRLCTPYGLKNTQKVARELSRRGLIVVTGLALGIDTAAAQGGLEGKMPVIGVIGCGIDIVYPLQNRKLFEKVADNGAIISEYRPGTTVQPAFFPARNRIISGLSNGVAVIEAPQRSGALITAERALEQGRDIFVLPGNVDSEACEGSNKLLRQGAIPFMTADDIIDEYVDFYPEIQKSIDNEVSVDYIDVNNYPGDLSLTQRAIVNYIGKSAKYADEIINGTGLRASEALAALTGLELSGVVKHDNGNRFMLSQ